jgi:ankyrin repeat protein
LRQFNPALLCEFNYQRHDFWEKILKEYAPIFNSESTHFVTFMNTAPYSASQLYDISNAHPIMKSKIQNNFYALTRETYPQCYSSENKLIGYEAIIKRFPYIHITPLDYLAQIDKIKDVLEDVKAILEDPLNTSDLKDNKLFMQDVNALSDTSKITLDQQFHHFQQLMHSFCIHWMITSMEKGPFGPQPVRTPSFLYAVENKHQNLVKALLLHSNIDVNQTNKNGWTALDLAINRGNLEAAKAILRHKKIQVNRVNAYGRTALDLAVGANKPDFVKALLAHKETDINLSGDDFDTTCLHYAIGWNYKEIVDLLLQDDELDVHFRNARGLTALELATRNNRTEIVKSLEAFIKAQPHDHRHQKLKTTIAQLFIMTRDEKLLLAPSLKEEISELFHSRHHPYTELYPKFTRVIQMQSDSLLLLEALKNGYYYLVEMLLEIHPVDVNALKGQGEALLHRVLERENLPIANILIDLPGIDLNAKDPSGNSPLMLATVYEHEIPLIKLLGKPGIDPNCTDSWGRSVLHRAMKSKSLKIVQALLSHERISVNSIDKKGATPLHLAIQSNNVDLVKLLLSHPNIDIHAKDLEGYSALEYAQSAADKSPEYQQINDIIVSHSNALNQDISVRLNRFKR